MLSGSWVAHSRSSTDACNAMFVPVHVKGPFKGQLKGATGAKPPSSYIKSSSAIVSIYVATVHSWEKSRGVPEEQTVGHSCYAGLYGPVPST